MDDEDDIYPENEPRTNTTTHSGPHSSEVKMEDIDYDEEEGEEVEDDDSDDEINFITDTKDDARADSQSTTNQGSQPKRSVPITADPRKATSQTPVTGTKPSQQQQQQQRGGSHTPQSSISHLQPQSQQPSQFSSQSQPITRQLSSSQQPGLYNTGGQPTPLRTDSPSNNSRPGSSYPARHTSTLDLNANPIHPVSGKPIFSTDLDADFGGPLPSQATSGEAGDETTATEDAKPWRKPGADVTDYFNYGFDEFTWASYTLKKQELNKEVKEIREGAESMKNFLEGFGGMPGLPGLPGMPTGPVNGTNGGGTGAVGGGSANGTPGANGQSMANGGAMGPGMPGMGGMPTEAEMQQMFQGMIAQGIDPSAIDPTQFMQMMMGGGMPGAAGVGVGPGGFGGNQPPSGPAMGGAGGFGGGFDQSGGSGGFQGSGRGGRGRRGRGNNW